MTLTELTCPSGYGCTFIPADPQSGAYWFAAFGWLVLLIFIGYLCWLKWGGIGR